MSVWGGPCVLVIMVGLLAVQERDGDCVGAMVTAC
jgi:hypothetical protein